MEKLSIWIGAIVAAFGVTWLVTDVNWWTTGTGYYSSSPFFLAAMVAGVGWAVGRGYALHLVDHDLRPRGRSPSSWSGLRAFLQRLFGVAVAFLLLSAFFAPFNDPKGPTYRAAMKSDLRNLITAQDRYRADSGRYASSIPVYFAVSSGVLEPVFALTADGWTASVDHAHSPRTCVIFVGTTPCRPRCKKENRPVRRCRSRSEAPSGDLAFLASDWCWQHMASGQRSARPSFSKRARCQLHP